MSSRRSGLGERIHGGYVHRRRVRVLRDRLADLLPADAEVVDVGCGDGALTRLVGERRPDVTIHGIDVLAREHTAVPVRPFDGRTLPFADASLDTVLFVDVLHHTDDPMRLLREATRVARRTLLIKDHTLEGFLAGATLRFMDRVGNARHGVALPHNYWRERRWRDAFAALGLEVAAWSDDLRLYPAPADWIFGRSLHFVASLRVPGT